MNIIPKQKKGASSATSFTITADNSKEARALFRKARQNLLRVNKWHELAGSGSAVFNVINIDGKKSRLLPKEGNYLRITIPVVPGPDAGEGDDWVKIEKIEEVSVDDAAYVAMRVRPACPPFANNQPVAHFFTPEATSTFCIVLKGRKVTASVFGRNEKPNLHTRHIFDKVRNFFVGSAAMLGLNKPQWRGLVRGLLMRTA